MEGVKKGGFFIYVLWGNPELRKEAEALLIKATEVREVVNRRNAQLNNKRAGSFKNSAGEFFAASMDEITISKDMEFLLKCTGLAVLRQPYQTLPSGVILTRTETSLLSKFCKNAHVIDKVTRQKLVDTWQSELSAASMARLCEKGASMAFLGNFTQVFTPDPKYLPKTFGYIFYEYQVILSRMKEMQGIVCLKSIVASGNPCRILLQSKSPGEEFALIPDEAYSLIDRRAGVVVFEGVMPHGREVTMKELVRVGFCATILACAAIEPPFARDTTLSDIPDPFARLECAVYRLLYLVEVKPFLALDHVYANTMQEEFP